MPVDSPSQEMVPVPDMASIPTIPASELNLAEAVRIPLDQVPSLGVALTALPDAFRQAGAAPATTGSKGEILYRVTDAAGNVLTPDMLYKFRDGSGLLGTIKTPESFALARLHAVSPEAMASSMSTAATFSPAMLFVATALAQVNQKLDAIHDLQSEMFAYARQRDHAKLVSSLRVLDELRDNYGYNGTNQSYLNTRHQLVSFARRDAEHAMELQRERLGGMLEPLSPVHLGKEVTKKTGAMAEALADYRLASYLYCYATLMDVMLVGNYDPAYLESIAATMERYSDEYLELYERCADRIEGDAKGSIGARVAGGIGAASGMLGRLIAATPVGDVTPIDDALNAGSNALGTLATHGANRNLRSLALARPGFMRPFIESVEEISRLHNEPVALALGDDALYVLPLK